MGVTKPISSVPLFSEFFSIVKNTLAIEYHVHIWQVSPQLGCGDTCQIWMWYKEFDRHFCEIENFAYGEICERSFSNPHPSSSAHSLMPVSQLGSTTPIRLLHSPSQGLYSLSCKTSTARSREVSKPRDSGFDFSNCSEIWQASRQHRCRDASQIRERYDH